MSGEPRRVPSRNFRIRDLCVFVLLCKEFFDRIAQLLLTAGFLLAHTQLNLEVQWDAPRECPSVEAVRASILGFAGERAAGDLIATGRVERLEDRYRLSLRVGSAGQFEEREVVAASCDEVAEAFGVIAGSILLERAAERAAIEKRATAETAPISSPASAQPPSRKLDDAANRAWVGLAGGAILFGAQALPELALSAGGRFGGPLFFGFGLKAAYLFPVQLTPLAELEGFTISPGVCLGHAWDMLSAEFCARASLFRLQGTGTFPGGKTDSQLWLSPEIALGIQFSLTRTLMLELIPAASLRGHPRTFSVAGETVFSAPEINAELLGGLRFSPWL